MTARDFAVPYSVMLADAERARATCPFRSVVASFGATAGDFTARAGARCELPNGHDGPHQFPQTEAERFARADRLADEKAARIEEEERSVLDTEMSMQDGCCCDDEHGNQDCPWHGGATRDAAVLAEHAASEAKVVAEAGPVSMPCAHVDFTMFEAFGDSDVECQMGYCHDCAAFLCVRQYLGASPWFDSRPLTPAELERCATREIGR